VTKLKGKKLVGHQRKGMKNDIMDAEALERQFEPIDDIVCYECRQTKFSACLYIDGECPLNLL